MPALGRHLVGVMEAIKGVVFLLEEDPGMVPKGTLHSTVTPCGPPSKALGICCFI